MKVCPHCKSQLNWKTVKRTRPDGSKWYEYSNQSFLRRVCAFCNNEIVQEFRDRWYYSLSSLICFPLIIVAITIGNELNFILKTILVFIALVSLILNHMRLFDYTYITVKSQDRKRIQSLIEYAQGKMDNPIEAEEYCSKYGISKRELNEMISTGRIEAYAFGGVDFLNDEPAKEKSNKSNHSDAQKTRASI